MRERKRQEEIRPEDAAWTGRVKTLQIALWTLAVLLQMGMVKCLEVRAETDVKKASELTVRYGIESRQEDCAPPGMEYKDEDGTEYVLDGWSAVPVTLPALSRKVQKKVRYDKAEGVTVLPETVEVAAEDRERGQTATAVCRMEEQEAVREEWQDGFFFTVTFHTYEAGYYQLADRLIPYNDERPELEGCEDLLLDLAGLPGEDYRVTHVQWSGGVYLDEGQNQCRDAAAFGQKRLRDYQVTYSGTAVFPEKEGWQTVAVYRLPQAETAGIPPGTEKTVPEPGSSVTEAQTAEDVPVKAPIPLWERITRTLMVTIAVGSALFLGGLVLLAILWVVKKLRSCYNRRKMKISGGQ